MALCSNWGSQRPDLRPFAPLFPDRAIYVCDAGSRAPRLRAAPDMLILDMRERCRRCAVGSASGSPSRISMPGRDATANLALRRS